MGLPVTLATRDYDFVAPLALGDVRAEGIALTLLRSFDALERLMADASINGGEASFSRYVHRVAAGDHSFVGLPVFLMREFRHRCFFVRRGSGLADVAHQARRDRRLARLGQHLEPGAPPRARRRSRWHPVAGRAGEPWRYDLRHQSPLPTCIIRGQDAYKWDGDGHRYIDYAT